nr:MAG TPA: YsxB-like protein [Caudoviricetes sp.]
MIEASVMRTVWNDGKTGYEVKAKGHAGAGKYGQDIVCAAVSCLMQTLANEVEEAARAGLVALGAVAHGEGWMRVEVTPTCESCNTVEAWVELVQDGLDALAESYPENVELMVNMVFADGKAPDPAELPDMVDGKMNLQLFADGDGGAAAGEGGAEAAPAVQEPALRPAQERLARRSGALRSKASPAEQPPQLRGQPEAEPLAAPPKGVPDAEEEKPQEQKAEKTPEEKRKAFGELVRGEYSDIFNEVMQQAIIKAGEAVHADPKAAALRQALSEAYGVDGEDVDGLIEAVKNGKVKDDAYYEELAQQRGVSVKTARELDKMESDLRRANDQNAKLQAAQQEAARQRRAAQIRAQWDAQAAQLKAQYPDFDLGEVLANEQVGELMRRGVSLPDAYRAAYFNHIMEQATARTAQTVEQGVTARIQQRAARPGENGTRPGGAVTTKCDISNTTRRQREELERRARRGEKIVL